MKLACSAPRPASSPTETVLPDQHRHACSSLRVVGTPQLPLHVSGAPPHAAPNPLSIQQIVSSDILLSLVQQPKILGERAGVTLITHNLRNLTSFWRLHRLDPGGGGGAAWVDRDARLTPTMSLRVGGGVGGGVGSWLMDEEEDEWRDEVSVISMMP